MSMTNKILLSIGILLVDLVVFFLPLTALFLIYILFYNPPWFRGFLDTLDKSPDETHLKGSMFISHPGEILPPNLRPRRRVAGISRGRQGSQSRRPARLA
jgi:hypothetical protein